MISKIFLQDWGIYEAWESPDFAHLTVIHGSNASGKSTFLDAISMLLGLCESYYLFEKRKPEAYQRAGQPAFLLGWFENPLLASGKRRSARHGEAFSVLCRVDGRDSPITQYRVFDGRVSLRDALAKSQRGDWLRPKDYDAFWKGQGVTKEQRRQRIFKVGDTDKVRASDPAQLHALFREYCSDPELVENQQDVKRRIRETEKDLDELEDALQRGRKAERETRSALDVRQDLKKSFEQLDRQRKLVLVAGFLDAERRLKRHAKDASNDERERIRLTRELEKLGPQLSQLKKEEKGHELTLKAYADSASGLNSRLKKAQVGRDAAVVELEELDKGEARLKHLRNAPTVKEANEAVARLGKTIEERSQLVGQHNGKLEELNQHLSALRQHRMPLSVQMCLADLEKAGIRYELARDHFPRDRPQGFEEAIGRARFALVVAKKDAERVLEIMARHDYPGPVNTGEAGELARTAQVGVAANESGFTTPLGEFVTLNETPFLNNRLVESTAKALDKKIAGVEKQKAAVEKELDGLRAKVAEANDTLRDALERDKLTKRVAALKKTKDDNEATVKEYDAILELWATKQREMASVEAQLAGARKRISEIETAKRDIDEKLSAIAQGPSSQLQKERDEKHQACREFLDELKDEADDEETHQGKVKTLTKRLENKTRPTDAEIAELAAQVEALEGSNKTLEGKIETQRGELKKSEGALKRLVEEHLSAEEKAFNSIQKSVERLGEHVGCPARVRRRQDGETWQLVYEVAYRVSDKGPVWHPVKNSSDSTGEGVKASMVFLMGLSQPEQVLFYVFDEPAKNFSPDNDVEMFKILQSTKSQVIISTARPLDYGDEVDVQQFFLHAEPRTTPNRKAKPAHYNRYSTVSVTP